MSHRTCVWNNTFLTCGILLNWKVIWFTLLEYVYILTWGKAVISQAKETLHIIRSKGEVSCDAFRQNTGIKVYQLNHCEAITGLRIIHTFLFHFCFWKKFPCTLISKLVSNSLFSQGWLWTSDPPGYRCVLGCQFMWRWGSNPGPWACEASTLSTKLYLQWCRRVITLQSLIHF